MGINSIGSNTSQLNKTLDNNKKLSEKLASGKRINSASDDPAGLAIADNLKAAVDILGQASRNVADVGSAVQIADSAIGTISDIGSRLAELSAQSSNGTLSDTQRGALQQEFSQLTQEIQRIAGTTEFNGQSVLDGTDIAAQVGKDSGSNSQINVQGADISALVSSLSSANIGTQAGAQSALDAVNTFNAAISSARGELGGGAARLEYAGNSIAVEKENAAAAESRIRDLDYAETLSKKVSNDILTQVNTALSAQSKLSAQQVLKLLA